MCEYTSKYFEVYIDIVGGAFHCMCVNPLVAPCLFKVVAQLSMHGIYTILESMPFPQRSFFNIWQYPRYNIHSSGTMHARNDLYMFNQFPNMNKQYS